MSAVGGFRLLLGKEVREQVRTLRLVVVVAVLALFGATSPLLAKLLPDIIKSAGTEAAGLTITMPPPTTADAVAQLVKNLGQFGAPDRDPRQHGHRRDGERTRNRGVRADEAGRARRVHRWPRRPRSRLLLGAGIAAGYALAWIYTAMLFETLPARRVRRRAALVLWLSLLVIGSVTFLFSVLARSSLVAGGAGFVALIVAGIVAAIPGIGAYAPTGLSAPAMALALGRRAGDLARPDPGQRRRSALLVVGGSRRRLPQAGALTARRHASAVGGVAVGWRRSRPEPSEHDQSDQGNDPDDQEDRQPDDQEPDRGTGDSLSEAHERRGGLVDLPRRDPSPRAPG